jgi:DNA repair exonuclease SbcCD ATPase subunit
LTRHNDQVLWGKKRYREDIAKLEEKLGQLQHNNALLKEVKAGRLLVADLLWTKVLTGTSAYFSRMRGEDSVVTRSSKGFMINGRPLVSGSTFDILGLALRITLVKLFSQCKLLILDEANAGADEDRTALMLGTLATAGFDQVLFVSHKPQDENACDHLIMV